MKASWRAGRRETIAELELELKAATAAGLIDFARELADRCRLRLGVLTKAERGYALADGSAGPRYQGGADRARAARHERGRGLRGDRYSCLRQFRLNEPMVIATQDPPRCTRRGSRCGGSARPSPCSGR
jgi:triphosphatase